MDANYTLSLMFVSVFFNWLIINRCNFIFFCSQQKWKKKTVGNEPIANKIYQPKWFLFTWVVDKGGTELAHKAIVRLWFSQSQMDTSLLWWTADIKQDGCVGWLDKRRIRDPAGWTTVATGRRNRRSQQIWTPLSVPVASQLWLGSTHIDVITPGIMANVR